MNRRNFLSRLPLFAATPLLFGNKPIHTGKVYYSEEEIDDYDSNVIESWRKIWMWTHSTQARTSIYADSVNIRFSLEYAYYNNPKNYIPKFRRCIEGDKNEVLNYMRYNYADRKIITYAENAMNNFIARRERKT